MTSPLFSTRFQMGFYFAPRAGILLDWSLGDPISVFLKCPHILNDRTIGSNCGWISIPMLNLCRTMAFQVFQLVVVVGPDFILRSLRSHLLSKPPSLRCVWETLYAYERKGDVWNYSMCNHLRRATFEGHELMLRRAEAKKVFQLSFVLL